MRNKLRKVLGACPLKLRETNRVAEDNPCRGAVRLI